MDTCPDFRPYVQDIENKHQREDALKILKHVWGLLDKNEQDGLFDLLRMRGLLESHSEEAKEELDEIKHMLMKHPEIYEQFNRFYSRVITPVTKKDQFKNDRIKAAAGLEHVMKQLQNKNLVKHFDIKRVA